MMESHNFFQTKMMRYHHMMLYHKQKQLIMHNNHMMIFHNFEFLETILLPRFQLGELLGSIKE